LCAVINDLSTDLEQQEFAVIGRVLVINERLYTTLNYATEWCKNAYLATTQGRQLAFHSLGSVNQLNSQRKPNTWELSFRINFSGIRE
jgi:hypothetical protein